VYDKRVAQGQLVLSLRDLLGPEIGPAIQVLLTSPRKPVTSLVATVFGTMTLFFGGISRIDRASKCFECNLARACQSRSYTFREFLTSGQRTPVLVCHDPGSWCASSHLLSAEYLACGHGNISRLANVR